MDLTISDENISGSFESEGKTHVWHDEERMLAFLLADGALFSNDVKDSEGERTVVLYVGCNDVFAWGTSDAETLPHNQIPVLFEMWRKDRIYGPVKWCMLRRNQKPQKPMEHQMRRAGAWDDECERIGENTMDAEAQAQFAWYTWTKGRPMAAADLGIA